MPVNKKHQNLILDFDNTIVACESLDELARISLSGEPDGPERIKQIKRITRDGMEGEIPFNESLSNRMKLHSANKHHVTELINELKHRVDRSFLNQMDYWKRVKQNVFIISNGFKSVITKVLDNTPVLSEQIFGNEFVFDKDGWIAGVDTSNPLAGAKGKAVVLESLGLDGTVIAVGDGISDAELKVTGRADLFFAFTGHVKRESVLPHADREFQTFDELVKELEHISGELV